MQNRAKKALELGELEEVKGDKEGLPPTSTKSAKNTANSVRKPPSSGKTNRGGTPAGSQKPDGETFLTDMLFKGDSK